MPLALSPAVRPAATALALLASASVAMGQNLVQIPPHNSTYTGFSRGYTFTANTSFVIARLEVPPDAMAAGTTAAVLLRVNGIVVFHSVGNVSGYAEPMELINPGDVVDVIGNWSPATTGNFTARNSYAVSGIINTTIEGVPHELRRAGVQWDISDPGWATASWINPSTGQPGRIFMYTLPPVPPCYADCDVNETLNIDDFLCFINEFAQAQTLPASQQITHYANCDGSTAEPVLTVDDFLCFINEFSQGCF